MEQWKTSGKLFYFLKVGEPIFMLSEVRESGKKALWPRSSLFGVHIVEYDRQKYLQGLGLWSQTPCFIELDVPDSNKAILSIKITNEQKKDAPFIGIFRRSVDR